MKQKKRRFHYKDLWCGKSYVLFFLVLAIICLVYITWDDNEDLPDSSFDSFRQSEYDRILNTSGHNLKLDYNFKVQDLIDRGRITKQGLNEIQNFVESLNHELVPKKIQAEVLALFLISCNNNLDRTKKTIVAYYEIKSTQPGIFDDRRMARADIQKALKTVHMFIIPNRTEDNTAIFFFKLNDSDYRNFEVIPLMKVSNMLVDIAQEDDPPDNIIIIFDSRGLGLFHMIKLKFGAIGTFIDFLQEGIPIKLKTIHVLYTYQFAKLMLQMVKPFLRNNIISDKLCLHSPDISSQELYDIVPRQYWPEEYNGDQLSEKELHQETIQKFNKKQTFWTIEEMIRKKLQ